jgi:hypothetical protein
MKVCKRCGIGEIVRPKGLCCNKCLKERAVERSLKWYYKNQEKAIQKSLERYITRDKQKYFITRHNYLLKIKAEVMSHYSKGKPKCACCGENELKFLCIDHKEGIQGRKRRYSGCPFYFWLKNNGYPKGFQVLCFNCNMAKGMYGKCPHKEIVLL